MAKDAPTGRTQGPRWAKPEALNDKLAAGRPATGSPHRPNSMCSTWTHRHRRCALLAGEPMPEPGEYLSAEQRDGQPLGADLVYRRRGAGWMNVLHRVRLQTAH
nr:hypothetical protein [Trueperella pyogenes]